MTSSVHNDIGDGQISAMPCSDSQPTRNVSVAGFVAGGAGGVKNNCPESLLHLAIEAVRRAAYGQEPSPASLDIPAAQLTFACVTCDTV
jgi:hypothetical protein